MAINDEITNKMVEKCLEQIPSKYFTTLAVVDLLLKNENDAVEKVKSSSPRNWRALIGKAIKRYSVETSKVKQISPDGESPARWEKIG